MRRPAHPGAAGPAAIAASHALSTPRSAVTRDGANWATPAVIAARVDLTETMSALRRGGDVNTHTTRTTADLAAARADSGLLYAPGRTVTSPPPLERLHAWARGRLVPVTTAEAPQLTTPNPALQTLARAGPRSAAAPGRHLARSQLARR